VIADIVPPASPLPASIQYVECDVRQPIAIDVEPGTTVYNLAAVHRTPGHPDHEYFETNVLGAHNVVDFARTRDVERLFFTSSIAVYGPSEVPVTETTPLMPEIAYGYSKLHAERIHVAWAREQSDRKLVVVRPGTVFGPGEGGNFTRLAAALAKRRFVYPGRRDTLKACGYVFDLIATLDFAAGIAGAIVTYNFGFPRPPSIEDVCEAFCKVGGYPEPRLVAPARVLLAAGTVLTYVGVSNFNADRVRKLMRSTNIVPELLARQGYAYQFDLETAFTDWLQRSPNGTFT
jgi:nucleoside-diphosphate-sugar epimerase